jgi:hypothetical protein
MMNGEDLGHKIRQKNDGVEQFVPAVKENGIT